jgi:GntR family transcriptional regulator
VAAVLDAIATGELLAGDKLPSVRGLASEALVNPNTVTKAYRELEHLGASEGRSMRGPDIVGLMALALLLLPWVWAVGAWMPGG